MQALPDVRAVILANALPATQVANSGSGPLMSHAAFLKVLDDAGYRLGLGAASKDLPQLERELGTVRARRRKGRSKEMALWCMAPVEAPSVVSMIQDGYLVLLLDHPALNGGKAVFIRRPQPSTYTFTDLELHDHQPTLVRDSIHQLVVSIEREVIATFEVRLHLFRVHSYAHPFA